MQSQPSFAAHRKPGNAMDSPTCNRHGALGVVRNSVNLGRDVTTTGQNDGNARHEVDIVDTVP